jgi:hypothetical protein
VGSVLAYRAVPLQSAYSAAKHAVRGFTDALRSELLHDGSKIHLTMVHLPGINTPQFSWCRTRLPRQPKPMGRIFQPEMAAEAVVWAADHHRREVFAAWPTVLAIHAQKFIGTLLDRYLAKKAWDGLLTDEPMAAERRGICSRRCRGPTAPTGGSTRSRIPAASTCGSTCIGRPRWDWRRPGSPESWCCSICSGSCDRYCLSSGSSRLRSSSAV